MYSNELLTRKNSNNINNSKNNEFKIKKQRYK